MSRDVVPRKTGVRSRSPHFLFGNKVYAMPRKFKCKMIAGILTAFNSGFLYYVIETNNSQSAGNGNFFINFLDIIQKVFIITIGSVVPLIFLIGIPVSLLIDSLLKKMKLDKNIISFILHMILFELGVLVYWIASFGWDHVRNMPEPALAYQLFLFSYTPAVFWLINYALLRMTGEKPERAAANIDGDPGSLRK